jgi:ABC-type glutathione transport system ATPase component
VLLLDEPDTGLDQDTQIRVAALLRSSGERSHGAIRDGGRRELVEDLFDARLERGHAVDAAIKTEVLAGRQVAVQARSMADVPDAATQGRRCCQILAVDLHCTTGGPQHTRPTRATHSPA